MNRSAECFALIFVAAVLISFEIFVLQPMGHSILEVLP